MKVQFKKLHPSVIVPHYMNSGDAAMDCVVTSFSEIITIRSTESALFETRRLPHISSYTLEPHKRIACDLGFATKFEKGYLGRITPRSGLAWKHGVFPIQGTIDSGYRGEWSAILLNSSNDSYKINFLDRVCQIFFVKLEDVELEVVNELEKDNDRNGGFGSTGLH